MRPSISIDLHGSFGDACYVVTAQGPAAVYRGYRNGIYPKASEGAMLDPNLIQAIEARGIRWGAYGDPAAIPPWLIQAWSGRTRTTGYTHQWRKAPGLKGLCMASVGSKHEAAMAQAQGWRTFRVSPRGTGPDSMPNEIVCPAAEEAGAKATCRACGLCNGAGDRSGRLPGTSKPRVKLPQGVVLWEGPSMLDGKPIVAIATGIQSPSTNRKTGEMVQVHILLQDEHPAVAQKSGADSSICGDCPLRPLLAKSKVSA